MNRRYFENRLDGLKGKRRVTAVFLFLALFGLMVGSRAGTAVAEPEAPMANALRISQVYGGGGNAGATYTHDFIEIFNSGASAVDLTGWSVQYAAATGSTWQITNLSGSIGAGQYYLIQQAQGAGGTTPLPTPDATGTIAMSATAGKVALVNTTTALTGTCPVGAVIVDFVGFGTTANCFEGSGPTPAPSNTNAVLRGDNGCTDTDDNSADFTAGTPTPRNSSSPTNSCATSPIAVDGDLSESAYVTIATKLNSNDGFGPNIDVTAIKLYRDEANQVLYIGVPGKLDTDNNNGIGLWLDLASANSTGIAAGNALGSAGSGGHYMGAAEAGFAADFEVDYMFALNPGEGNTSVFFDVVKLVDGRTPQYLGMSNQSGDPAISINSEVFDAGSVTFAFDNSGAANKGMEMAIPYDQIGLTPGASNIYAFAFVVSNTTFAP